MASVSVSSSAYFSVQPEEKEVLQKAHDILDGLRREWNLKSDEAWDDERYWQMEEAVNMLKNVFHCSPRN